MMEAQKKIEMANLSEQKTVMVLLRPSPNNVIQPLPHDNT